MKKEGRKAGRDDRMQGWKRVANCELATAHFRNHVSNAI